MVEPDTNRPEAVIEFITSNEFREASDPDNITFFQLGIFSLYYGRLQDCACPLPLRAYNMCINMGKDTTNLLSWQVLCHAFLFLFVKRFLLYLAN